MATNNNSNRYPSEKGRFFKGKTFILWSDYFSGQALWLPYIKHPSISLPMNLV